MRFVGRTLMDAGPRDPYNENNTDNKNNKHFGGGFTTIRAMRHCWGPPRVGDASFLRRDDHFLQHVPHHGRRCATILVGGSFMSNAIIYILYSVSEVLFAVLFLLVFVGAVRLIYALNQDMFRTIIPS